MQASKPIKDVIQRGDRPSDAYHRLIEHGVVHGDEAQVASLAFIERLFDEVSEEPEKGLRSLFSRKSIPDYCGLYLWGGVGRGKSMLMDLCFELTPIKEKRRVHFHACMREVHARLHSWRQLKSGDDLLPRVVDELARDCRFLCLDEMQVHDVTDAMILSRLFTLLFERGVLVMTTSNRAPEALYQGGIQREQFMQFIELINEKLDIVALGGEKDYRLDQLKSVKQTYIVPNDAEAIECLQQIYTSLTQCYPSEPMVLHVNGRRIPVDKAACGVAWFTFAELCARPLGAADYLEIAAEFHTIILQGIPLLSSDNRNEAKRFVTLIDTLYEQRCKLICSAEGFPATLYAQGDGAFEFQRTVSRLEEMQSERYLALEHQA